jgi:multiple sugar transport system permease protein
MPGFDPFIMIILLAGLQAMPKEVQEAARSMVRTAAVRSGMSVPHHAAGDTPSLIIRIIFKLKLFPTS